MLRKRTRRLRAGSLWLRDGEMIIRQMQVESCNTPQPEILAGKTLLSAPLTETTIRSSLPNAAARHLTSSTLETYSKPDATKKKKLKSRTQQIYYYYYYYYQHHYHQRCNLPRREPSRREKNTGNRVLRKTEAQRPQPLKRLRLHGRRPS